MDSEIRRLQDLLASRNKSRVIWQTECSAPSSSDTAGWGGGQPWNETKQAKWLLRRFLSDASLGMVVSLFWTLNDCPGPIEQGPKKGGFGINHKGLYRWGSWEPKRACYAFQHLTSLLDSRLEARRINANFEIIQAGSFAGAHARTIRTFALADKKSGAPVLCYWLPVPMKTEVEVARVKVTLPSGAPPDPVLVDLLDGRVYTVSSSSISGGKATFEHLPLTDYPVVLCGRGIVEFAPR